MRRATVGRSISISNIINIHVSQPQKTFVSVAAAMAMVEEVTRATSAKIPISSSTATMMAPVTFAILTVEAAVAAGAREL